MREIVLDTETTGFDPESGDRIVEIGAVELHNHVATGNTYHQYINPERSMPQEAFEVHGLGDDFLRDKPKFAAIGQQFLDFVQDSKLVIHNAAFDMKFLNAELGWINLPQLPWEQAVDTLAIARKRFPGSPASLDALCRRFNIDNSSRTLHGALLDSEILAEVYLELIGGRQPDFALSTGPSSSGARSSEEWHPSPRPTPLPARLTQQERALHEAFVENPQIAGSLWNILEHLLHRALQEQPHPHDHALLYPHRGASFERRIIPPLPQCFDRAVQKRAYPAPFVSPGLSTPPSCRLEIVHPTIVKAEMLPFLSAQKKLEPTFDDAASELPPWGLDP